MVGHSTPEHEEHVIPTGVTMCVCRATHVVQPLKFQMKPTACWQGPCFACRLSTSSCRRRPLLIRRDFDDHDLIVIFLYAPRPRLPFEFDVEIFRVRPSSGPWLSGF